MNTNIPNTTDREPVAKLRKSNPRREELKALSQHISLMVKEGIYNTVNERLVEMYEEDGHEELNTFWQWKAKGFSVKKGAKALLLWGRPKRKKQDDSDDEYKFFPICYVFSEHMVEPIKEKTTV